MDKVRIGPITYEVKTVERLVGPCSEKLDGQIIPSRQLIEIDGGLTLVMQRQTLWHEIIHGILTQSGRHELVDEGTVDAIAYGVFGVINDNPEMVTE